MGWMGGGGPPTAKAHLFVDFNFKRVPNKLNTPKSSFLNKLNVKSKHYTVKKFNKKM
jgi:hypothetical protein